MIESISILGIIIGLISILIFGFIVLTGRQIESNSYFAKGIFGGFFFGVFSLVVFIGHNLIYSDPEIYIDNYSGKEVQIFIDEKHFIDVKNSNSLDFNSLRNNSYDIDVGNHIIVIKDKDNKVLQELDVYLYYDRYYILNVLNKVLYLDKDIVYTERGGGNPQTKHSKEFFNVGEDNEYIFSGNPPRYISVRGNRYGSVRKRYLRRIDVY